MGKQGYGTPVIRLQWNSQGETNHNEHNTYVSPVVNAYDHIHSNFDTREFDTRKLVLFVMVISRHHKGVYT